jgi:hypothetical protein
MIDALREDDRFKSMKRELDRKIEVMHDNVERAEESDDWSELLNRVRGDELTASLRRRIAGRYSLEDNAAAG